MGYYIQVQAVNYSDKCQILQNRMGATPTDPSFKENLVCVVDNGPFAAIAYCYSKEEFEEFNATKRKKSFFVLPDAAKLSGYN